VKDLDKTLFALPVVSREVGRILLKRRVCEKRSKWRWRALWAGKDRV